MKGKSPSIQRFAAVCLWGAVSAALAADDAELSPIVVPVPPESAFKAMPEDVENVPRISDERRTELSAKVLRAFSEADEVMIVSLEPVSRERLKVSDPAMARKLKPRTVGDFSYYGSVELDAEQTTRFATAILTVMNLPVTPRLGFCWEPRHAVVLRTVTEPDLILSICYRCGGMKMKDGDEGILFVPPSSLKEEMDALFDARGIPRSKPGQEQQGIRANGGT